MYFWDSFYHFNVSLYFNIEGSIPGDRKKNPDRFARITVKSAFQPRIQNNSKVETILMGGACDPSWGRGI